MATKLLGKQQAFDLLRIASQHGHRKLRDIALEVTDTEFCLVSESRTSNPLGSVTTPPDAGCLARSMLFKAKSAATPPD